MKEHVLHQISEFEYLPAHEDEGQGIPANHFLTFVGRDGKTRGPRRHSIWLDDDQILMVLGGLLHVLYEEEKTRADVHDLLITLLPHE